MAIETIKNEIVIRRKMGVYQNKMTSIPIDVIEAWGDKIPKYVVFTIFREDGKVIVTIEPGNDDKIR